MIKMILAVDEGNSIGWFDGRLPWKIPGDMKRFKALTTGHVVLMGRKTFESLNLPDGLPNRKNVVVTSGFHHPTMGNKVYRERIEYIDSTSICDPGQDLWIIGGARVYAEAIKRNIPEEIFLTQVHTTSGADVRLPFELYAWKLFVLRERARGNNWVVHAEDPPTVLDGPKITFVHLKKVS